MTNTPARIACACLITLACAVCVSAQQTAPARTQTPAAPAATPSPVASAAAPPPQARANADEDFELNIGERRITEENFEASTEAEVGDGGGGGGRGVNLRVGVAVGAEQIDVLLRNVRGRVRFRASLDDVLRRLGLQRRADAPTPTTPP